MTIVDAITHNIAPDGDVVLYLKNANAPFAVWPIGLKPQTQPQNDNDTQDAAADKAEDAELPKISFRLSSKHLMLASEYFSKMLHGPWKESQDGGDEPLQLTAEDWDEEALLVIMNIIHSRSRQLPRTMDLELLAKITVIVDYYQCHESVEFHTDFWFNHLVKTVQLPNQIDRKAILWLHVSWVFSHQSTFRTLTKMIQLQATRPVPSLELPIHRILEEIEVVRIEAVRKSLSYLQTDITSLSGEAHSIGCKKEECSSMLLGKIIRHAAKHHLHPFPEAPYHGISFSSLISLDRSFSQPAWYLGPLSSVKAAAIATEVSELAYRAGYTRGRRDKSNGYGSNNLNGYNEGDYNVQNLKVSGFGDPPHCCKPAAFKSISNWVLGLKCGFDLTDFDPEKAPISK